MTRQNIMNREGWLKFRVGKKHDKRRKLTDEEREEIKHLYATGDKENYSQRKLAKMFGVSRRLITFIVDPEKLKADRERLKERGGSKIYYDKEKQKKYMRNHRKHIRNIIAENTIDN